MHRRAIWKERETHTHTHLFPPREQAPKHRCPTWPPPFSAASSSSPLGRGSPVYWSSLPCVHPGEPHVLSPTQECSECLPPHPDLVCHLSAPCSPSLHTFGDEELTTHPEGNLKKKISRPLRLLESRTGGCQCSRP